MSRYLVLGDRFYDQDMTFSLHRYFQLPGISAPEMPVDAITIPPLSELHPIDGSGGFTLEMSTEVRDGDNPELKDKATRQLMAMKETLKESVVLSAAERLALDPRVPTARK